MEGRGQRARTDEGSRDLGEGGAGREGRGKAED